jgi:hypothetical protein
MTAATEALSFSSLFISFDHELWIMRKRDADFRKSSRIFHRFTLTAFRFFFGQTPRNRRDDHIWQEIARAVTAISRSRERRRAII